MRTGKAKLLTFTLTAAAENWGVTRETIKRGIASAGIAKTNHWTIQEVNQAVFGDDKVARIRKLNLEADLLEQKQKEAAGELVRMGDVERLLVELVVIPLRQALLSAPTSLDTRCNPGDPELARAAVQGWVDDTLKLLREKLTDAERTSR